MKTMTRFPSKWVFALAGIFLGLTLTVGLHATDVSKADLIEEVSSDVNHQSLAVARDLSDAFATVAENVNPSVVTIFTETDVKMRQNPEMDPRYREFFGGDFFDRFFQNKPQGGSQKQMGLGSGVIVDENGIILTNNHVVRDADEINVRLMDGREFVAKVKGADPQTDLAVISIDAHNLTPARLGDSDESRVGEWVLAVGSPLNANLEHTVTSGIISAKGRSGVGLSRYEDFIQTDAAINPGNSGGALVNLDGELIGINTAIATRTGGNMGIGFAIPVNLAKKVMGDIIEKGSVDRGWLGVHIQTLSPELAKTFELDSAKGVVVSQVQDGSPASRAGLEVEDVIVGFNGKPIDNAVELSTLVAGTSPGATVTLDVVRGGKTIHVDVRLERLEAKELAQGESTIDDMGLSLSNITGELRQKYELKDDQEGVVITGIAPNSTASEDGLREGDVVLKLNREPIHSVGDFSEAMDEIAAGDNALFYVQRGDARIFVALEMPS